MKKIPGGLGAEVAAGMRAHSLTSAVLCSPCDDSCHHLEWGVAFVKFIKHSLFYVGGFTTNTKTKYLLFFYSVCLNRNSII